MARPTNDAARSPSSTVIPGEHSRCSECEGRGSRVKTQDILSVSLPAFPRSPRLRAKKLRLSLDKLLSFYVRSVLRVLNSLANLFFHYKSYPDFYTPPRQLSLSFDFAREGTACWIPFAAGISAASKYPSEDNARPDRSRRACALGCTLACTPAARSTVFRAIKRDGGRNLRRPGWLKRTRLRLALKAFGRLAR